MPRYRSDDGIGEIGNDMPVPVQFFTLTRSGTTYAFKPESISFGDDESLEVKFNRSGDIKTVPLSKKTVTLTLEGAVSADLTIWQGERDQNIIDMIAGTDVGEDIVFGSYTIFNAYLRNMTPSAPLTVNGITTYESIELEFVSQVYV